MIVTDSLLSKRHLENRPIVVGIIGAGEMAKGMINQVCKYTKGMVIGAVYNRTPERALKVFNELNIPDFLHTNKISEADEAVERGKTVITNDLEVFFNIGKIEIVVEATGAISFGAEAILKAFEHGKHVLSFNAELDSTLGPILLNKAKTAGVKYSLGDGDQPGVTMNLYRYVKAMGFEPLVCGNIKGMLDYYRTPATQKGFAESWGMAPEMATNFADGTKVAFEQSCIANATGMSVAKRGMYAYESKEHVDNLTHLYDVSELREKGGIVEFIIGAKPSPGVFVYATTDDPFSKKYLDYGKLGKGPLYSFYVPFHLLFFDIASAIVRLIDLDDPVIVPKDKPYVDVITVAKKDLMPGEKLDGIGGFNAYGLCENHYITVSSDLLPMGLSQDCELKNPIKKDSVITYNDVILPQNRMIDRLMKEQIKL
ncbi:NAD(P)H-dependent oxidoreductase [Mongoliibacter ruber]|uniref:Putative homoserine dehydrogenase-like protein n=1 Tax=Mongoliibacter ruber TaxID=1750599 RepID=A0A2T0WWA0_9BACT|nr:Gfo/Idh/MocA family oxidoreductase [Mongoliibacter ruber]PRY90874.1 putative homoserine dehydrogenase-like protein [Mongoliibacter ruber]